MKKSRSLLALSILCVLSVFVMLAMTAHAGGIFAAGNNESSFGWFWETTHTIQETFNAHNVVVVVEGKVGAQVDPAAWNVFMFGDGGDYDVRANFGDSVPAAAIPLNKTVRIVGEAKDGEIAVHGLQILEALAVKPNATAAEINDGSRVDQDVSIRGKIGDRIEQYGYWNYYQFTDSTGIATVDLPDEGELPISLIPQNMTCMIYGVAKNSSTPRLDSDYILLADSAPTVSLNIMANNLDGDLSVTTADYVSISIHLDPLQNAGRLADTWIAVSTPTIGMNTWYSYLGDCGWRPGINLNAQSELTALSDQEILRMKLSGTGEYTFYFAIDNPNGFADGPWWGIDSVKVTVSDAPPQPTYSACCLYGNCVQMSVAGCQQAGGTHIGDVSCEKANCNF